MCTWQGNWLTSLLLILNELFNSYYKSILSTQGKFPFAMSMCHAFRYLLDSAITLALAIFNTFVFLLTELE